jgi:hypothetical protein
LSVRDFLVRSYSSDITVHIQQVSHFSAASGCECQTSLASANILRINHFVDVLGSTADSDTRRASSSLPTAVCLPVVRDVFGDRRCNDGGVVCGCVSTRTRGFYFS